MDNYEKLIQNLKTWGDMRMCIEDCKFLKLRIGAKPICMLGENVQPDQFERPSKKNCKYYVLDRNALAEKERLINEFHMNGVI